MNSRIKTAAAALLLAFATGAGASFPVSASAAQPGDVCIITNFYVYNAPVYSGLSSSANLLYTIPPGDAFRIEHLVTGSYHYYGHGSGRPSGYMERKYVNQASCHP